MPCNVPDVAVTNFRVSDRGQMALPAGARRRWDLLDGGTVEIADLGDALVVVPAGRGGLRAIVASIVDESGGYAALVAPVIAADPDLA